MSHVKEIDQRQLNSDNQQPDTPLKHPFFVEDILPLEDGKPAITCIDDPQIPSLIKEVIYELKLPIVAHSEDVWGLFWDIKHLETTRRVREIKSRPPEQPFTLFGPWEILTKIADHEFLAQNEASMVMAEILKDPEAVRKIFTNIVIVRVPVVQNVGEILGISDEALADIIHWDEMHHYRTIQMLSNGIDDTLQTHLYCQPDSLIAACSYNRRGEDSNIDDTQRAIEEATEDNLPLVVTRSKKPQHTKFLGGSHPIFDTVPWEFVREWSGGRDTKRVKQVLLGKS